MESWYILFLVKGQQLKYMKLLGFGLFIVHLKIIQSKECFITCGSPDRCQNNQCSTVNSNCPEDDFTFEKTTCLNPDDLCVYRETTGKQRNGNGQGNNFKDSTVAFPGGCLLEYQHQTEDIERFLFSQGTRLFTCSEDSCNTPPDLSVCRSSRVVCFVSEGLEEDEMFENQVIRKIINGERIKENNCLLDDFRLFSAESDCFRSSLSNSVSTCESLGELVEFSVTTCADCDLDLNCNSNEATEGPTVIITQSPTVFPSNSPTNLPTESPISSPTTSPTKNPTQNPTFFPSKSPSLAPTFVLLPTESPTRFITQNPTILSTKRPTVTVTTKSPTESPILRTDSPTVSEVTSVPEEEEIENNDFEETYFLLLLIGAPFCVCLFCAVILLLVLIAFRSRKDNFLVVPKEYVQAMAIPEVEGDRPGVEIVIPQSELDEVLVQKPDDYNLSDDDDDFSIDVNILDEI